MKRQLDDKQIAKARELRAAGFGFASIREAIGADVAADTIRGHCADVVVVGGGKMRQMKGAIVAKDGRTIRPFSEYDDARIIAWVNRGQPEGGDGRTMADLARQLGRKWHSVRARVNTLRKHGKLPA